ncbi:unnamed protein product [Bemisia tabaci]|uniref:Mitochondrial carnitine/acylcarnitine carrier protein n=1 Tax=Bemisia tabaci TaxID=7038 RepID=A0A9P0EXB9_BEMTA|nr:PREDICTED: mitochondrial carnitine/acylcarnitine carrier protein-like [Bemisia tabaci]CAH0383113.1 unnamed protein product [Bemisia tabaci]
MSEEKKITSSSDQKVNPIKDFISGGAGGVCAVLIGHPLDTIKVRLQTMPQVTAGQAPLYAGTLDCATKIIKKEGPLGLYKGMAAPLTGVAPIFALSFFGFGVGKKIQQNNENEQLSTSQLFYAGAFAGVFTTVIMAPGERIKCLLQIQEGSNAKYKGPIDVVKHLYKEGGIRSIFKGTAATLLRDIPASGMYFMTYESIKKYLTPADSPNSDPGIFTTIFAGGMAGVSNWLVGMPPDTLKSRLQTAPEGTYPNGIRDVFKKLRKEEGLKALYRGCAPVMIRAFPANGACFVGYEFAQSALAWAFPNW